MYLETIQLTNEDISELQISIFDGIKEKYQIINIEVLHLYRQVHITSQNIIPEFKIVAICSNNGYQVSDIKRSEIQQ